MERRHKLALYGIAGLVLAAEAAILAMALTPDVDPVYRAYYIDRTADCYPLPVTGEYALGTRVSFGANGTAERLQLARCGWRDPDATGSWSDGDRSLLRFAVASPPADLLLELVLQPYVDRETTRQRVEVTANDTSLGVIELEGRTSLRKEIVVPAAAVGESGLLDITLQYPDARALSGPSGTAPRIYAVFLYSLRLSTQASAVPSAAEPRS